MIVPRSRLAEVEEKAVAAAEGFTPGDAFDADDPVSGRWSRPTQRDRVRGYIKKGIDEGAKLLTGGAEAARRSRQGLFRAAHRLLRGDAAT